MPDGVEVIDAHVHLFPPGMFDAIWRWFDAHAWPVRYRLHSEEVIAFLRERGVSRFCALHYAHKPGLSALLNRYVAELAAAHRDVVIRKRPVVAVLNVVAVPRRLDGGVVA